jgi:ribosome-binding factor A
VARIAFADPAAETLEALNGARGLVRRILAERVDLFRAPDLDFEAAVSPDSIPKMKSLLRRVRKGRPKE